MPYLISKSLILSEISYIFEFLATDLISRRLSISMFTESLITRVKTINNDMIKLDTSVSSALDLTPDLDRIARAENFVEDGSIDVRRD